MVHFVSTSSILLENCQIFLIIWTSSRRLNSAIVSAANGALESLTRGLALELAPVRVNCVSPGIIDTPIRAAMPEAARREMLAKTAAALPVGRVGVGEDIARQILAFMANGFATGSIVYLDGGALVT